LLSNVNDDDYVHSIGKKNKQRKKKNEFSRREGGEQALPLASASSCIAPGQLSERRVKRDE
jgi:hypothetical protein